MACKDEPTPPISSETLCSVSETRSSTSATCRFVALVSDASDAASHGAAAAYVAIASDLETVLA